MENACENCGTPPPGGPYALHDYCVHCSKNLCGECMTGKCRESPTGQHEEEET